MKKRSKKRIISLLLCFVLLFVTAPVSAFAEEEAERDAVMIADTVRVRSGPGTNFSSVSIPGSYLNSGQRLIVHGDAVPDSLGGAIPWYSVSFTKNDASYSGFVRSDFVRLIEIVHGPENTDFESELVLFPESYREALIALHEIHPSWHFEAFDTGIDWNTAQENENVYRRSMTESKNLADRSTAPGCYDWSTDQYIVLEGKDWYQASPALVAFYMDPRNWLNEANLFQFEKLSYDPDLQTVQGVEGILAGSFMSETMIWNTADPPEEISYAQAFMDAAALSGVSAYHLAARCIQEVGRSGTAVGTCGDYPGLEGYYNYFSVGAYTGGVDGLVYAKNKGWDTPYKAILGGSTFIGSSYIDVGQDTLYFQKFSVVNESQYYWHQYAASVAMAQSEAGRILTAYNGMGLLETAFTFRIPFYQNMPETPSPAPASSGSPNAYLSDLSISGFSLTPTFEILSDNTAYSVIINAAVTSVTVNASAVSNSAWVSGNVGEVPVARGENHLTVYCTAANGAVREYTLSIVVTNAAPDPSPEPDPPTPPVASGWDPSVTIQANRVCGIEPGSDVAALCVSLGTYGNASALIVDEHGNPVSQGQVRTGLKIRYFDGSNTSEYNVILYGDVNKDGEINLLDLATVQKVLVHLYTLDEVQTYASDVNHDGVVDLLDLATIQKQLVHLISIDQGGNR